MIVSTLIYDTDRQRLVFLEHLTSLCMGERNQLKHSGQIIIPDRLHLSVFS